MVVKNILFRFDAYEEIGMGHAFRCSQLMKQILPHKSIAVISTKSEIAKVMLEKQGLPYVKLGKNEHIDDIVRRFRIDIVVNDILNTDYEYMQLLKKEGCRVVNLEDEGEGKCLADAVINELYEREEQIDKQYYGSKYYCLSDSLLEASPNLFSNKVKKIVVLFGCTDPEKLTEKTIRALQKVEGMGKIITDVVIGPGNKRSKTICKMADKTKNGIKINTIQNCEMSQVLKNADLAISSQGRTIFEIAHFRIPTIIMSQNERERTHTFASLKNGFINLGLGKNVSIEVLSKTIEWLFEADTVREEMYELMKKQDMREGINRVKDIILGG